MRLNGSSDDQSITGYPGIEKKLIALRDRNFPVEYLMAPDEGHGFARPVNNMAMFMAAERFLSSEIMRMICSVCEART